MQDFDYLKARNRRLMMLLVFFLLIPANIWLYQTFPILAGWLPIVMIILGGPMLLLSMISYGRFAKVFDYEPTSLLGRPTNGKQARMLLQNVGIAGAWLSILGLFTYLAFQ